MERFVNTTNAFNYVYERTLEPNEEVIIKMPAVTPNKRGINDIGWLTDGEVLLQGTICSNPADPHALWQEIAPCDEVNKTVSAIKAKNIGSSACHVVIRAILN